jgi:hypothetical protein
MRWFRGTRQTDVADPGLDEDCLVAKHVGYMDFRVGVLLSRSRGCDRFLMVRWPTPGGLACRSRNFRSWTYCGREALLQSFWQTRRTALPLPADPNLFTWVTLAEHQAGATGGSDFPLSTELPPVLPPDRPIFGQMRPADTALRSGPSPVWLTCVACTINFKSRFVLTAAWTFAAGKFRVCLPRRDARS